jgi:hypothetical protein
MIVSMKCLKTNTAWNHLLPRNALHCRNQGVVYKTNEHVVEFPKYEHRVYCLFCISHAVVLKWIIEEKASRKNSS